MKLHDFLYFSKGERRGLIVLLCLITIAGILLIINERKPDPAPEQEEAQTSEAIQSADTQTTAQSTDTPAEARSDRPQNNRKTNERPQNRSQNNTPATKKDKETTADRAKRLTSYSRPAYPRSEKFKEGVIVELNTADTTTLKKVPGIGSSYAKRIVGYRNLLGGYYAVTQLSEIYGMDEEHYRALAPWFSADPSLIVKMAVNDQSHDSALRRHPYLSKDQTKIIFQLRRQKGKLEGWENLHLLSEFADTDRQRLQHYLSFE